MLSDDQIQSLQPKLLQLQMVAAAILAVVVVATCLIGMIFDWEDANERMKMLNMIATATGFAMYLLSAVAPPMFSSPPHLSSNSLPNSPTEQAETKKLANFLLVELIIRYALIDAGIFLNLMVAIVEPHLASFVVSGFGTLLMLLAFPRKQKTLATLERRLSGR